MGNNSGGSRQSSGPKYEALRGGNYREGGKDAVVGEVYDDVPAELVPDLKARNVIRLAEGTEPKSVREAGEELAGEVTEGA